MGERPEDMGTWVTNVHLPCGSKGRWQRSVFFGVCVTLSARFLCVYSPDFLLAKFIVILLPGEHVYLFSDLWSKN